MHSGTVLPYKPSHWLGARVTEILRATDYEFGGQEFESLRARHRLATVLPLQYELWVTSGVTADEV